MMPVRVPFHRCDEAQLREEIATRRAAYQQRLARDQRLLVAFASLALALGSFAMAALAGAFS